jgi:hypothetical protein
VAPVCDPFGRLLFCSFCSCSRDSDGSGFRVDGNPVAAPSKLAGAMVVVQILGRLPESAICSGDDRQYSEVEHTHPISLVCLNY